MASNFIPYQDEQYDFVIPAIRQSRPAVIAFQELLQDETIREKLRTAGFVV